MVLNYRNTTRTVTLSIDPLSNAFFTRNCTSGVSETYMTYSCYSGEEATHLSYILFLLCILANVSTNLRRVKRVFEQLLSVAGGPHTHQINGHLIAHGIPQPITGYDHELRLRSITRKSHERKSHGSSQWRQRESHPPWTLALTSLVNLVVVTAGSAVTHGFITKSPKLLETARTPRTRLRMTNPPASFTRWASWAFAAV